MTLTTALHLHRGGTIKGPAGTGKTETVKDLSKSLGMHFVVVNCSEGLGYKSMGRLFSGLAQVRKIWSRFAILYLNYVNSTLFAVSRQERGDASMSSTTSTWKCFQWWLSRSISSSLHSQQ